MIAGLTGLRTEVDDPDGLVRFTLGDDGRLWALVGSDAGRRGVNTRGLEKKLTELYAGGNEGMRLSRRHLWEGGGEGYWGGGKTDVARHLVQGQYRVWSFVQVRFSST